MKWLLNPGEGDLLREVAARTADAPCRNVPADAEPLGELMRDRHFGVATGRAVMPEIELPDAQTWGDLAGLQAQLREQLRDQHFRFYGATRDPGATDDRAAVEHREIDGVLVVRARRLVGPPADDRAFAGWVARADRDFAYDRIVVDLRGNSGGNDGHTYEWIERRLRAVAGFASDVAWCVDGQPLSFWNMGVWRNALYGTPLPAAPAGDLELVEETYDLPQGDRPWGGRMLVVVDRRTRSSGESSAWLLRQGLGARLLGEPTMGMIEYGNVCPYVLPGGLAVSLPTKRNDYGFPVELVGFPVDEPLDPETPVEDVARRFDSFV